MLGLKICSSSHIYRESLAKIQISSVVNSLDFAKSKQVLFRALFKGTFCTSEILAEVKANSCLAYRMQDY